MISSVIQIPSPIDGEDNSLFRYFTDQFFPAIFRSERNIPYIWVHVSSLVKDSKFEIICPNLSWDKYQLIILVKPETLHVWSDGKDAPCFFPLSALLSQVSLCLARFAEIAQSIGISRKSSKIKSSRMFSESPENGCGRGT